MSDLSMIIGGERAPTEGTFGVINPATGEVFAQAPDCSKEQLDAAFDAAKKAQLDWRRDEDARRQALRDAANKMFASAGDIAPILMSEQGKPLAKAGEEVFGAGIWFNYYADLEVEPLKIQEDDFAVAHIHRRPHGVVAAITPWNFPLVLASWKIAPALRAGNTMVLKPSPYTPLATLKMVELLNEVLPPGVLNVVTGGDELGKWMTAHPTPRKVSFTGSVAAGKHVYAACAPDLKRVTLELGGNDPAIVLDDVDVEATAEKVFRGAFENCGQICSAIKRVYVPESIHGQFVEALAAKAAALKVGEGTEEGVEMGPINNAPQFERVKELVADAIAGGATAVTGGAPMDRPGYFFQPTILDNVHDGSRIVDEEQFGPALPVIPYRHLDEAIDRANATHFGLSGSVWGADIDKANAVADQLECGTSWVNAHLVLQPHQPFGGFKWSGVGVENGPWGLDAFTDIQVRYTSKI
ncbi:MAG TPA: aldehyde dehydrogenase family protein [Acidimicrobiales bacterium]|nr:aldehyde dehydrogenase family protein [Acidimicrobiales bacterium]